MNSLPKKIYEKLIKHDSINDHSIFISHTKNMGDVKKRDKLIKVFYNSKRINSIRYINKFHEKVNGVLIDNGYYITCARTLENRVAKVKRILPSGLSHIFIFFDFIINRVTPKLPVFKKIYFFISRGKNRILSSTEILGRLISCGFMVVECFEDNDLMYVISKKIKEPSFDKNASHGPLFKMRRIGYKGKVIYIYKIRTMHPYSEFLQKELYDSNLLGDDGDKIKNDFRVTSWGRFFRKFWIDELPQLYNLIRGDIRLVGVRAVSLAKFELYDKDLQDLRIKVKPGLIPPYYADLPKNFDEFQESEKKYILLKMEAPLLTDIKYFFRALINILFKGARSQ